jgi:hypothetical protein
MSDNPISRPSLSQATIDYNKSLLTPEVERDHPDYSRLIRNSLETALAASGQDKPPADPRTDQQRFHDMRYGVEPGRLPDHLMPLLVQGDADQGKAAIEGTGRDYAAVLDAARAALTHSNSQADPRTLSAGALVALAAYSDYLGRWAAGRPKKD